MKVLVTGANGFVGKALSAYLLHTGHEVKAAVRQQLSIDDWLALNKNIIPQAETLYPNKHFQLCFINDLGPNTDWSSHLTDIDVVIHLAARVHVMHETAEHPLEQFRLVNVEGTSNLAKQAIQAHVKRFIYISSIKVNGEETINQPFKECDIANPQDPYGISKFEAEQALQDIVKDTGMEYVIIRPTLIYGPGVGGNFLRIIKLVKKNIPLPFKKVSNKRSMIFVENLADLIITTMQHPQAANQIFLAADETNISTAQLIQYIAVSMGKSAKLFNLPFNLLQGLAKVFGKQTYLKRLTGSLEVDTNKSLQILNWKPPVNIEKSFKSTIAWYSEI